MRTKEAVEIISLLITALRRKTSQRHGPSPAFVILNEYPELHDLLGTIEGFLSDKNILPYIQDLSRAQRQVRVARWLHDKYKTMAQHNQLTPQAYQNYERFTATLDATIEDKLQDTNTLLNTTPTSPSYPSLLQRAYRNVAMIVLGLAAAYAAPTFAQDVARGPPAAEKKDTPKKEETKDYVAEFKKTLEGIKVAEGKDALWYNNRGTFEFNRNKLVEAAANYYRAIEIDSELESPYCGLGSLYCKLASNANDDDKKDKLAVRALSLYDVFIEKATKSKNISEETRKDKIRRGYENKAGTYNILHQPDKIRLMLTEAAKYGPLSESATKLLNGLAIK